MLFYSKEMKQIKKAQELNKIEEYLDKLKEHDATWIQQEITHNTICKLKAKIKNQEGKIIKFSKPEKNEYTTNARIFGTLFASEIATCAAFYGSSLYFSNDPLVSSLTIIPASIVGAGIAATNLGYYEKKPITNKIINPIRKTLAEKKLNKLNDELMIQNHISDYLSKDNSDEMEM